ncbi:MAG: hypothetical protein NT003_04320 [Candidatus Magasanikbacteria bacterium]|nr:hypothetical protein [Candidatus Magasanikbacteria bacterium]
MHLLIVALLFIYSVPSHAAPPAHAKRHSKAAAVDPLKNCVGPGDCKSKAKLFTEDGRGSSALGQVMAGDTGALNSKMATAMNGDGTELQVGQPTFGGANKPAYPKIDARAWTGESPAIRRAASKQNFEAELRYHGQCEQYWKSQSNLTDTDKQQGIHRNCFFHTCNVVGPGSYLTQNDVTCENTAQCVNDTDVHSIEGYDAIRVPKSVLKKHAEARSRIVSQGVRKNDGTCKIDEAVDAAYMRIVGAWVKRHSQRLPVEKVQLTGDE